MPTPDLSPFETSILRALSESDRRTIFAISSDFTGTESTADFIQALDRMRLLQLVAAPPSYAAQTYLRTKKGTEWLAETREGVEE